MWDGHSIGICETFSGRIYFGGSFKLLRDYIGYCGDFYARTQTVCYIFQMSGAHIPHADYTKSYFIHNDSPLLDEFFQSVGSSFKCCERIRV